MMVPEFSSKQLTDICRLRTILEGEAAEQAALRHTNDELNALRSHVEEIVYSAESYNVDLLLEANYHFHMQVAEMSKVSFIKNFLEPLWMHIGPSVRRTLPTQAMFFNSARHHQDVYDAIASRNGTAAAEAMRVDILDGVNF